MVIRHGQYTTVLNENDLEKLGLMVKSVSESKEINQFEPQEFDTVLTSNDDRLPNTEDFKTIMKNIQDITYKPAKFLTLGEYRKELHNRYINKKGEAINAFIDLFLTSSSLGTTMEEKEKEFSRRLQVEFPNFNFSSEWLKNILHSHLNGKRPLPDLNEDKRNKDIIEEMEKEYGNPKDWKANPDWELGIFYYDKNYDAYWAIEEPELLNYIKALRGL